MKKVKKIFSIIGIVIGVIIILFTIFMMPSFKEEMALREAKKKIRIFVGDKTSIQVFHLQGKETWKWGLFSIYKDKVYVLYSYDDVSEIYRVSHEKFFEKFFEKLERKKWDWENKLEEIGVELGYSYPNMVIKEGNYEIFQKVNSRPKYFFYIFDT